MASPQPRPAALKLLNGRSEGTDSGGRKVKPPPPFVRSAPEPPSWLDREAKAEWKRITPELERLKLLRKVDRAALASYCETWSLFVVATKEVHDKGITVENHSTRKDGTESTWFTANPAVATQLKAQQALRAWCAEFGLTPSAEGKVSVPEGGDDGERFDVFD